MLKCKFWGWEVIKNLRALEHIWRRNLHSILHHIVKFTLLNNTFPKINFQNTLSSFLPQSPNCKNIYLCQIFWAFDLSFVKIFKHSYNFIFLIHLKCNSLTAESVNLLFWRTDRKLYFILLSLRFCLCFLRTVSAEWWSLCCGSRRRSPLGVFPRPSRFSSKLTPAQVTSRDLVSPCVPRLVATAGDEG